jgi:hypothetical protein
MKGMKDMKNLVLCPFMFFMPFMYLHRSLRTACPLRQVFAFEISNRSTP